MKIKNFVAVSLVEVVVASVIFLLAAAGALGAFSMAQKMSTVSEDEAIAANYGRQLLEDLRAHVDQRTWNSWYLTCDSTWRAWPTTPTGWDAFQGTAHYNCTQDPTTGLRKVNLNVVW